MQCEAGEAGMELRKVDKRLRFSFSTSFLSCEMEIFFLCGVAVGI